MSSAPPLVLFDVDGTLLRAGDAAQRAYARAFEEVLGVRYSIRDVPIAGRTDHEILHELLGRHGWDAPRLRPHLARIYHLYARHLEREIGAGAEVVLLPGVRAALEALEERGATLALLTGNVAGGARLKLSLFGLNRYFPFGAFGNEAPDRAALVAVARERARARTGRDFAGRDVVVVGDSPNDVACARAHGARAVGVATGWTTREELLRAGADAVLPDLADRERALSAVLAEVTN